LATQPCLVDLGERVGDVTDLDRGEVADDVVVAVVQLLAAQDHSVKRVAAVLDPGCALVKQR